MDVAQPDAWERLRDRLQNDGRTRPAGEQCRRAGSGEVGKYSLDDWQWILGINLNAGIYGCHYFIPWLKEESARAPHHQHRVAGGRCRRPGMAGYNVTKAGMLTLSETLYGELKPHNMGVTVVCPSFFQTNLLNEGRLEKIDRDLALEDDEVANFTAETWPTPPCKPWPTSGCTS